MNSIRPLDVLNAARGKRVIVHLVDDQDLQGTLVGFDLHCNLSLENVEHLDATNETPMPSMFIPGHFVGYVVGP